MIFFYVIETKYHKYYIEHNSEAYPLFDITGTHRRCIELTRFSHRSVSIDFPARSAVSQSWLLFVGWASATASFTSHHKYAIVLRSGDWVGHFITSSLFLWKQSFVNNKISPHFSVGQSKCSFANFSLPATRLLISNATFLRLWKQPSAVPE